MASGMHDLGTEKKKMNFFKHSTLFKKRFADALFDYSYRNSFFFLEQIRAINHTENIELDLNKRANTK